MEAGRGKGAQDDDQDDAGQELAGCILPRGLLNWAARTWKVNGNSYKTCFNKNAKALTHTGPRSLAFGGHSQFPWSLG